MATALQTLAQSGISGTVSVNANYVCLLQRHLDGMSPCRGRRGFIFSAAHYNITPAEVSNILFNSAQDLGSPGRDDIFGYGLVDANAALNLEKINILTAFADNWLSDLLITRLVRWYGH